MEDIRRFKNFTDKDIKVVIALVKKYAYIVKNKISNAVTWKEKSDGWETIAKEYQALTGEPRSSKNLRGKWKNMKKNTKKKFAEEKQDIYKTGGGPYVETKANEDDYIIKDILGVSVEGLPNTFDSDNIEIVFEKGDEEEEITNNHWEAQSSIANDITVECENNWATNQKTPKSSEHANRKPLLNRPRKKAEITNECKNRITALSQVKIELCQLQMQCLKEDNARKLEKHELELKEKKEIHLLEVQRKQLQLDLLKKQILNS